MSRATRSSRPIDGRARGWVPAFASADRASTARRPRGRTRDAPWGRRRSGTPLALSHVRRPKAGLRPRSSATWPASSTRPTGPAMRSTTRPRSASTSASASAIARTVAASGVGFSSALIGQRSCRGRRRGSGTVTRVFATQLGRRIEASERVAGTPELRPVWFGTLRQLGGDRSGPDLRKRGRGRARRHRQRRRRPAPTARAWGGDSP